MDNIFPIAIAIVVAFAVAAIIISILGRRTRTVTNKSKDGNEPIKQKNRTQIIRNATHKLSQDAHNPEALLELGNLYFTEHQWEKAYPLYDTLFKISGAHPQIDLFLVSLRSGICAAKLNKTPEAIASLSVAYKLNPYDFDVNYYVGLTCYQNKEYEKAIPCLKASSFSGMAGKKRSVSWLSRKRNTL